MKTVVDTFSRINIEPWSDKEEEFVSRVRQASIVKLVSIKFKSINKNINKNIQVSVLYKAVALIV